MTVQQLIDALIAADCPNLEVVMADGSVVGGVEEQADESGPMLVLTGEDDEG